MHSPQSSEQLGRFVAPEVFFKLASQLGTADDEGRTLCQAALEKLVITADEVARLLSISERQVWALHSSGRLPRPIRFGRSTRWSLAELRSWINSGAPPRDKWEIIRSEVVQ